MFLSIWLSQSGHLELQSEDFGPRGFHWDHRSWRHNSGWSSANIAHTVRLFSEAVLLSFPRVDHLGHSQISPRSHENDSGTWEVSSEYACTQAAGVPCCRAMVTMVTLFNTSPYEPRLAVRHRPSNDPRDFVDLVSASKIPDDGCTARCMLEL